VTRKVKILGITDKRIFCYKKSHNDFKFVSSHKELTQIEAGQWKIPIWLWLFMIGTFFIPLIQYIENPDWFNTIFLILPIITFILCIFYRKFDFIITAVGCERFSVISRRKSILEAIKKFIDEYHSKPPKYRSNLEDFVQSNYIGKWFQRFISIVTFLYSPIPFYIDILMLGFP
jgi:hypothetical protein